MIVIRLCCFQPTYLSQPSLLCDFCPSDQRFAYSFLRIPPHDGHPCCSAIRFPLSGRVRDFHPLGRVHGAQTKKSGKTEQLTPDFYWNPSEKVEEFQYLHKNQCRMDLPILIYPNTCENQGHFQQARISFFFHLYSDSPVHKR